MKGSGMHQLLLYTIIPFHLLVVFLLVAMFLLSKRPQLWYHLLALFTGLVVGFIDLHSDEIQLPALLLLAFGFFLGFAQPKNAWRWALYLGIWVPIFGNLRIFIEGTPDKLISEGLGSLLALLPAFLGVYAGVGIEWLNMHGGKTIAGNTENGGRRWGSRWRIAAWTAAALLLLLPLVAMQFTDEVNWDVTDFAFAGALLVGTGITYELAVRKTGDTAYRAAIGVALAAAFILVWVNGAVGIIGTEREDANLMYGGVLAVGIIGAIIARFQAHGMARALLATALAQALVAVIALLAGLGGPGKILILNGFFVALFVGSAWLFRKAARGRAEQGAE
jgi:hypothetical protein